MITLNCYECCSSSPVSTIAVKVDGFAREGIHHTFAYLRDSEDSDALGEENERMRDEAKKKKNGQTRGHERQHTMADKQKKHKFFTKRSGIRTFPTQKGIKQFLANETFKTTDRLCLSSLFSL